jgi:hypothetical protein
MAVGDAAAAAGMSLVAGSVAANTIDTELNRTRDYIADRTNAVTPVAKGGTGSSTAAGARTNLGVPAIAHDHTINDIYTADGTTPYGPALQAALDNETALRISGDSVAVQKGGDTMTGHLFLPNSYAATSGWTAAYINGDGRVSRGASSERYKKYISEQDALELGDIWEPLNRFQMKGGDGRWTYGHIAERLAENPDTERFVMYDDEGRPDSIDYIPLLLAKVEQLAARVAELEAGAS